MRVTALADDILRVRAVMATDLPEDASWAVPEEMRGRSVNVSVKQRCRRGLLSNPALAVRIERSPLRLIVSDLAGHVISADAPTRAVDAVGGGFTLRKVLPQTEHFFGLGDKTGPLDRRGQAFTLWNTDAYHFQESTDPIYKSIPFFVAAGGPGGSYGILLDNTWRSWFDFGKQDPQTLAFGSAAGPIDYYLIYGPSVHHVVERYTDLTGKPPLTPVWALGFQQSRYSYMSAAEVHRIADRLRAERIPADVIWLDIDYQDRNRPFTTNPTTFPDLPGLARACGNKDCGWWSSPTCISPRRRIRDIRPMTAASPAIISSSGPMARSMSARSGQAPRCFPISPAATRVPGGDSVPRLRRGGHRRFLERHERALGF